MTIILDGKGLSIDKLVQIARFNEPVKLADEAVHRIQLCRGMLEEKLQKREIMYFWNCCTCSSVSTTSENSPMPVLVPYMISRFCNFSSSMPRQSWIR